MGCLNVGGAGRQGLHIPLKRGAHYPTPALAATRIAAERKAGHQVAVAVGRKRQQRRRRVCMVPPRHLPPNRLQRPAVVEQLQAASARRNDHCGCLGQHLALGVQRLPDRGGRVVIGGGGLCAS
ncbi:hypothetical protein D3C72_1839600 [compost metagenome]